MRLDLDQYSLPLLPNTRAHPSTNPPSQSSLRIGCTTSPDSLASKLPVIQTLNLFYRSIAFERPGWDSKLIHRFFFVFFVASGFCGWTSLMEKFLFCFEVTRQRSAIEGAGQEISEKRHNCFLGAFIMTNYGIIVAIDLIMVNNQVRKLCFIAFC